MENNSLFPFKYRLRKTDEAVEVIAWETVEKGARNENDWVSYIDASGVEHIKERLTLEWDFKIETPFEKGFLSGFGDSLTKFDAWESRRYELTKELFLREWDSDYDVDVDSVVAIADEIIDAMKAEAEVVKGIQEDDGYENIGIGEIVEAVDGPDRLKKFVFTDKKDIVGFRGDSGRWNVGDRVKVYIKHFLPQEEERPVP